MIVDDQIYREMLCRRIFTIMEEHEEILHEETQAEIRSWASAFIEESDRTVWDVDVGRLDQGALELLSDFVDTFKSLWLNAFEDLGILKPIHKIIHWQEHRKVKTIINDTDRLLEDLCHQRHRSNH